MNIIEKPVDELIPYENNPRVNDDAVPLVVKSIQEFGFKVPIVIDRDNVIVTGHTRLKAAKQLGMKTVPCIIADDLTPEQVKAFRLADNKVAEFAEWDFSALEKELKEIEFDMSEFGFEELEEEQQPIEEDEIPGKAQPRAKRGEVYQLGQHRLMCGDSTSAEDVQMLVGGVQIDLLLTDPPYGISVVQGNQVGGGGATHFGKVGGENIVQSSTYMAVKGDDTTETAEKSFIITKDITQNQIIFGGNYFTDFLFPSRCWIVWDKQNTGNFADAELAWTSFDRGVKLYHYMWNGLAREGSRAVEGIHRVHPTQKPVGMLANILKDFSKEGETVLDCFGGSGSTLIACEQAGRKCFMMEYEPHYIDVIIQRWEDLTGEKAVLLNG